MNIQYLPQQFFAKVRQDPAEQAFFFYSEAEKQWLGMDWQEYGRRVSCVARWLQSQGVGPGDKVALLSGNRPEWMITDLAILALGAVSVPIYATSSAKDIAYIADHSESKMFFVDQPVRAQILKDAGVGPMVTFDPCDLVETAGDWQKIIARDQNPELKLADIGDDTLATIIYTSGTTGLPKGVMHTHGNFRAAMEVVHDVIAEGRVERDRFFSFLPLSHVAERVLVQLGSICTGAEVAFARSVSTLGEDLVTCRPSILLCVPRLWEKMHEKIESGLKRAPLMKRMVFALAKALGAQRIVGDAAYRTQRSGLAVALSDKLVGRTLREKLGLDRARMLVTGSAPTRPAVMKFFGSFGLLIREVYGLTENMCLGVLNDADHVVFGSCGKVFKGNEIRIAEDQEIEFRAPWMFKGYYKNPEATAEVLDAHGWFSTGDLGKLDDDGYLRIVGRKKELLKTSTGKYVAPVPIEDRLKGVPGVADAMVVGDNQKYCIALIALDEESDCKGDMGEQISSRLGAINQDLANHESIKRVGILETGFSVEAGTLTPTLKLKRKVATDKYHSFIDRIYSASEMVVYEKR